jgi:uncharacterized protein (TIGR02284 family)
LQPLPYINLPWQRGIYETDGTIMNQPTMKPDQVISTLNSLIEINRDGQKGFQEAAEKIETPEIKAFCFEQSRSRAQFVGELQPLVQSLGSEPDNTGSIAGALHRGWIDLKSALGGGDHAILAATETGEDSAVKEYKKALDETLPAFMHEIVERQFQSVKQAHDKVKAMRDRLDK